MFVLLPQLSEGGQVLVVVGLVLQGDGQGVRVDLCKGVVDLGQVLRRDLGRGVALVGRPAGVVAHHLAAGLVCTPLRPRGGAQQQCRHAQAGQCGDGSSDESSQGKALLFPMIVTAWRVPSRSILPERRTGPQGTNAGRPARKKQRGRPGSVCRAGISADRLVYTEAVWGSAALRAVSAGVGTSWAPWPAVFSASRSRATASISLMRFS